MSSRATKAFEKALVTRPTGRYVLRLYVAGATERSRQAIVRARRLCETELDGNFELEVIDVYQQPILARDGQIVATPTLVKEFRAGTGSSAPNEHYRPVREVGFGHEEVRRHFESHPACCVRCDVQRSVDLAGKGNVPANVVAAG
jgi:circadian clock protein KaiB